MKDLLKGLKTLEFGITPDFGIPLEDFEGRNGCAKEVRLLRHQLGSIIVERVGPTYEEAGHEGLSS